MRLRTLLWAALLAGITALLSEAVSAFDDYETVKTIWNGNGLATDLVSYGVVTVGATVAILLATFGFHRVQQLLGRSLPPSSAAIGASPNRENWGAASNS